MTNGSVGCEGLECPAARHFRTAVGLRRTRWASQMCRPRWARSLPLAEIRPSKVATERGTSLSTGTLSDNDDVEEFPLLLASDDVSALIRAADRHGLCAASLARLVIQDFVLWIGSDVAKTMDGVQIR